MIVNNKEIKINPPEIIKNIIVPVFVAELESPNVESNSILKRQHKTPATAFPILFIKFFLITCKIKSQKICFWKSTSISNSS